MKFNLIYVFLIFLAPLPTLAVEDNPLATSLSKKITSARTLTLDGVVEATKKATVSAQVSGRVIAINFDVGDYVKKDNIIMRIRDNEYSAQLKSAQAQLKNAKAKFNDAKLEFKRIKNLHNDNIVSTSKFDKASATLKSAEAGIAASKARISEAKEKLNNTVIRAPFSGIVTKRHIEAGESIRVGQAIMTGFSMKTLRVSTDVSQKYISAIKKFNHAVVHADDSEVLNASKITVFPIANNKTHTFHVRALLPNKIDNLFPGMFVKIAFQIGQQTRLLIPTKSIVHRSEVTAVYVINNSKIQLRQIREGQTIGQSTEILAGLEENEVVATDPIRAGIALKKQWETR